MGITLFSISFKQLRRAPENWTADYLKHRSALFSTSCKWQFSSQNLLSYLAGEAWGTMNKWPRGRKIWLARIQPGQRQSNQINRFKIALSKGV